MRIEEAKPEHIPKLVDMWLEFMKELDSNIISANPELREHEIKDEKMGESYRKFLESKIGSENGTVFIAREGSELAGYTLIFIKDEIPIYKNKKLGYVSDIYVKKEFRNMAISSALMEKATEWFRKKGMNFVAIPVSPDNKIAYAIYKKWGFIDYRIDMRKKI